VVIVSQQVSSLWASAFFLVSAGDLAASSLLWPTYVMKYDGDTPPPAVRFFTVSITLPGTLSSGQLNATKLFIPSASALPRVCFVVVAWRMFASYHHTF